MKAVISVVGKDAIGIIAGISAACAENNVNILDISQSVLHGYFSMIMITDIDHINIPFTEFVDKMSLLGEQKSLRIHAMHEDIFNAMHSI